MVQEELQVLQVVFLMAHCGTKEGSSAGGRCKLQRPEKVGQESYANSTREVSVDLIVHLEVSGSEDGTEANTHGGTARNPDCGEAVSGSTAGGQDKGGE